MRMMAKLPSPTIRRRIRAASPAIGIGLLLGGCQPSILDSKGPIGAAENNILLIATVIMLAIIVPTMIATVIFAWWYRESNPKARYRPDWAFSGRIELVVWSIPLLTIIFLGGIAWIGAHDLDPGRSDPLGQEADPGSGRVARLEMAVHLPRTARRRGQPARRTRRYTDPVPPDLEQRLELVLRPRPRQHDLHDARDGHPAQPAGRPRGRPSRPVDPFQRRRLLGHELHHEVGLARRFRRMGRLGPGA